jgi:hypothetical protein
MNNHIRLEKRHSDIWFHKETTSEGRIEIVGGEDFNGYRRGSLDLKAIDFGH